MHASPPCTKASTQNGTDRDLDEAEKDTRACIGLLENIGPAVWTLENVPPLFQRLNEGIRQVFDRGEDPLVKTCRAEPLLDIDAQPIRFGTGV